MGICQGKVHAGDSRSCSDQGSPQQQQPVSPRIAQNTVQLTLESVSRRLSSSFLRSPRGENQLAPTSSRHSGTASKRVVRTRSFSPNSATGPVTLSNSVRLVSIDNSRVGNHSNSRSSGAINSDTERNKKENKREKLVEDGIDALVQDERVRTAFFEYLHRTADASEGPRLEDEHTETLRLMMHHVGKGRTSSDFRQDCVLFWLEIHDLMKIPPRGSFRALFVRDIYDLYIAHGSARQLPILAPSDVEEVGNLLEQNEIERVILNLNVFLLEAQLVVTSNFEKFAEIYAQELKNKPSQGDMRNVLERLSSVSLVGNDRRTQLKDIINDPQLCRALREFLQTRNSLENLLFVIDALEFEDLANTYHRELGGSIEQNHQDYCVCQANKIFNKYVRYGSKAEVGLSAAIKDRVLHGLAEPKLRADLFSESVLVCSGEIVSNHLEAFYKSDGFMKVVEARRQITGNDQAKPSGDKRMTSSMFDFFAQFRVSDPNGAHHNPNAVNSPSTSSIPDMNAFKRNNLGVGGAGSTIPVGPNAGSAAISLQEILNGVGAPFFRDFLRDHDMENTLLFYKEVAQFQLLPHGQKHYIQGKARKIFDRYLRRGAKLEVQLPPTIRRDVLFRIADASESTFSEASRYILSLWEKKYLDLFLKSKYYEEMKSGGASSGGTGANGVAGSGAGGGGGSGVGGSSAVGGTGSTATASTKAMVEEDRGHPETPRMMTRGNEDSRYADLSRVTLRNFLDSEVLRAFFRSFLEKELCVSELHFYMEIAHFQQLPTSDYLTRQAKKLHRRFCDHNSKEFVQLSEDTTKDIETKVHQPGFEASPALFMKAQEEILSFFNLILFPKFQQSEIYRNIRITREELKIALNNASSEPSNRLEGKRTMGQLLASAIGIAASQTNHDGDNNDVDSSPPPTAAGAPGAAPERSTRSTRSFREERVPTVELLGEDVSVVMILENPTTRAMLLFFAEEIFCTENIYFWLDCNEFKDIPHRNYMKLRAQKIFRKYISPQSKMQVNLDSTIVKDIVTHIAEPTRNLFIPAQKSITKMLEGDTLQKFKASKHFEACLRTLQSAHEDEQRNKRGEEVFARSSIKRA